MGVSFCIGWALLWRGEGRVDAYIGILLDLYGCTELHADEEVERCQTSLNLVTQ